jgi:hypothetical protein
MIALFDNGINLQIDVAQKAGSSSVVNYLLQCFNQYNAVTNAKQPKMQLREERKLLFPRRIAIDENNFEMPENIYKKIIIIRDPVERLRSVYADRVVHHNRNNSRDTIQSWEDFVSNLEEYRTQFHDISMHSRKQVEYFLEDNIDLYDAVFNTVDINKGVRKYIESIMKCSLNPAHIKNRKTYKHKDSKDKKLIDKIKNFYADDYNYFKNYLKEK